MDKFLMCLVSSFIGGSVADTSCITPLGEKSQCMSLYECPLLLEAFDLTPIPNNVALYLKNSQCGLKGNVPDVCCGPLPVQKTVEPMLNSSLNKSIIDKYGDSIDSDSNVKINRLSPDQIEQFHDEDSKLESRQSCGENTGEDRIYGGTKTDLDEFPWMALLGYRKSSGNLTYQCGGVLINKRYVLTAAHCITGRIEEDFGRLETIRLGEYDKRTEIDCVDDVCADKPQEIPVQVAVAHPRFRDNDSSRRNDIGIARLARRAQYNFFVKPICLVSNNVLLEDGTKVFVAGWGKTLSGANSDVKEKLTMPIFRKDDCVRQYRRAKVSISDEQICAGGVFKSDTCNGDSGGSLMRRLPEGIWESVAIVSFGNGCGRDGWPGVYTSVAHYLDWVEQTMRSTNV